MVAVNDGVITDDRQVREARPLHRPPRRLRQPLHLRPARRGLRRLPGAEAEAALGRGLQARHPRRRRGPGRAGERRDPGRRRAGRRRRQGDGSDSADEPGRRTAGPGQHRGRPRAPLRLPRAHEQRRPRRPHRPARLAAGAEDARLRVVQGLLLRRPALRPEDDGAATAQGGLEGRPPGTVLGRIGKTDELAPHVHFSIRPAGRGAPKIDPKPILDGWKLLEATAIYRAAGENPFNGAATAGQVLLMSKPQLIERGAHRPALEIYACGREDIRTGQIDRRVLAMLEYLAARGFQLTLTSLKCGHSVSPPPATSREHSSGNAVDIAQINGMPMLGNQGPGTISEALVKRPAQAPGDDEAAPDHLADGLLRRPTTPSRWATTPTTSTSATRRSTARAPGSVSKQFNADPQARPVGAADRPPRRDRQPDGADRALRRRAARRQGQGKRQEVGQARLERPPRRVAAHAALPLRPARARRHGRARGRPLPGPRPRAGARRPGRRRPARRRGAGSAARSPRTPSPDAEPTRGPA